MHLEDVLAFCQRGPSKSSREAADDFSLASTIGGVSSPKRSFRTPYFPWSLVGTSGPGSFAHPSPASGLTCCSGQHLRLYRSFVKLGYHNLLRVNQKQEEVGDDMEILAVFGFDRLDVAVESDTMFRSILEFVWQRSNTVFRSITEHLFGKLSLSRGKRVAFRTAVPNLRGCVNNGNDRYPREFLPSLIR